MKFLLTVLSVLGPVLVAILTVPLFDLLKKALTLKSKLPDWIQQIAVTLLALGLTALGHLIQVAIPTDLTLFDGSTVAAVLTAAIAMAIKAGQKADGTS